MQSERTKEFQHSSLYPPASSRVAAEVAAWLAERGLDPEPADAEKFAATTERHASRADWQRELYRAGWLGHQIPQDLGGHGGSLRDQAEVYAALVDAHTTPFADPVGLTLVIPALLRHGPRELARSKIPEILRAEAPWCQGFSEKGAGSDLAALETAAASSDGGWVVNGHKLWSTYAAHARWCMLLARTGGPGARGLTMLALPMDQPGIEVHPIPNLAGRAEFNEIVIEDAFVPEGHLFGAPGQGWPVAMTVLAHERSTGMLSHFGDVPLPELLQLADGLADDVLLDLAAGALAVRLLALRAVDAVEERNDPGVAGPLTKWLWSEVLQSTVQLGWDQSSGGSADAGRWEYQLPRARSASIEGGTSDVLASIVAERILGLPRSR